MHKILCPAVKYGNSEVYVGRYHKEAERNARELNKVLTNASYEKGFLDSFGKFLNLKAAYHVAFKSGQITRCEHCFMGAELSSEALKPTEKMVEQGKKLAKIYNENINKKQETHSW